MLATPFSVVVDEEQDDLVKIYFPGGVTDPIPREYIPVNMMRPEDTVYLMTDQLLLHKKPLQVLVSAPNRCGYTISGSYDTYLCAHWMRILTGLPLPSFTASPVNKPVLYIYGLV
jgi:hypothetical protein